MEYVHSVLSDAKSLSMNAKDTTNDTYLTNSISGYAGYQLCHASQSFLHENHSTDRNFSSTIAAKSASQYIIGNETLISVGSEIAVSDISISLDASDSMLVVGSKIHYIDLAQCHRGKLGDAVMTSVSQSSEK